MACLLVPATAAIITTASKKKVPSKYHLEWLNTLLWGGAVMLLVEHIAHGEIVFYPPFLTAMQNPADISVMLQEIAIVGGGMVVAIVAVWAIAVAIANRGVEMKSQILAA